jgi:hypothetical protein
VTLKHKEMLIKKSLEPFTGAAVLKQRYFLSAAAHQLSTEIQRVLVTTKHGQQILDVAHADPGSGNI